MMNFLSVLSLTCLALVVSVEPGIHGVHSHQSNVASSQSHVRALHNTSIAGTEKGCKHQTPYFLNPNVKVQMCTGQTDQDLKNGMSIINLINSRGFLPTCRVMQLMLWMAATVNDKNQMYRDLFVDVGANIGSCSVHMAALGFPVVSVEPVQQHVDTIRGSIDSNPSFHIDLHHIGLSSEDRLIRANFGHGARNWGASEFHEVGRNDSFETELKLRTLDHVIGHRRVALLKVDCEGCEWETLKRFCLMLFLHAFYLRSPIALWCSMFIFNSTMFLYFQCKEDIA